MRRTAFTLLEVLLVIGIVGVLAGVSVPFYRAYLVRHDLNIAAEQIAQGLGRARLRAVSGEGNAEWGYSVPHAVLFRGHSYATRDAIFDEPYPMSSSIVVSGLAEVSYSRLHGKPSATGSIVLTSILGEQRTVNILITSEGIPTTGDDRLTICHCKSHPQQTLQIPDSAWPGHQKHGDHLGVCTGAANECH